MGWMRRPRRATFDSLFPTFVRYAGFVLILYSAFVDRGRNPALIPAATGMIFFKTIVGSNGNGNGKNGHANGQKAVAEETQEIAREKKP